MLRKACPQTLVTPDQLPQTQLQRRQVQLPLQPQHRTQGVCRAHQPQLLQEPQPLLRMRQRHPSWPGACLESRQYQSRLRTPQAFNLPSQLSDRRGLKQPPHRQLYPQHLPHSRDHPHRQQRVTAQLEEIVVYSDTLHLQHLLPDPRKRLLHRRTGRFVLLP